MRVAVARWSWRERDAAAVFFQVRVHAGDPCMSRRIMSPAWALKTFKSAESTKGQDVYGNWASFLRARRTSVAHTRYAATGFSI